MATSFVFGVTSWQADSSPARSASDDTERFQPLGRYSSGARVVYEKSTFQRRAWILPFTRLNEGQISGLLAFLQLVEGMRRVFTWTDHLGTVRTVRFTQPRIDYRQTGPDRYEATVGVFEDDSL